MAAAGCAVTLKRKVRSAETKLFEWRPCLCVVAARGPRLLLLLRCLDSDGGDVDEDAGDAEAAIDLASQLVSIAPKKNRARCELEYRDEDGGVQSEQLMAPSSTHCQRWIMQIRRAQEQARQQQDRRASASPQPTSGSPVAPLPSSSSPSPTRENKSTSESPGAPVTSSTSTGASNTETARSPKPQPREIQDGAVGNDAPSVSASSSLASSVVSTTLRGRSDPTDGGDVGVTDTEDSSFLCPALETELAAASSGLSSTAASLRSNSLSSCSTPPPAVQPTRRRINRAVRSPSAHDVAPSSPSCSSSDSTFSSRSSRPRRPRGLARTALDAATLDEDDELIATRRRHRRRSCQRTSTRFSVATDTREAASTSRPVSSRATSFSHGLPSSSRRSASSRLSLRRLPDAHSDTDGGAEDGEAPRAELHILQRVEGALRALELENAQAKARERELVQQIQALEDAARVAAAERRHAEHESRHAQGEAEAWRRSAQSAEAAAAHWQEQLGIAREENQLLVGERRRLKRQNGELLAQVHRLDSLVYGRF